MKKIPTLFVRDPENRSAVTPQLAVGLIPTDEWVATEKVDGTCCLVRGGSLFKRYTLRRGKAAPEDFEPATEVDPVTGKQEGWVPVGDGPEDKFHREAWDIAPPTDDGTYELVGPKVQGNPHGLVIHRLWRHGAVIVNCPPDFNGAREFLETRTTMEGVVWWCDGEPVAKIKRRDLGLPWPAEGD